MNMVLEKLESRTYVIRKRRKAGLYAKNLQGTPVSAWTDFMAI